MDKEVSTNKTSKIMIAVLAVIMVIFVAAFSVGLATGWLKIGANDDSNKQQPAKTQTQICGNDDVEKYNAPIVAEKPPKDYENEFDAFYNDIKNRPGNEQDATCQYILYAIAYFRTNDAVKQHFDNIEKLNAEGEYPNNRIYQLKDIEIMRLLLP